MKPLKLSIVVPFYNEEQNVAPLIQAVSESLKGSLYQESYEIIGIDDGSRDGTLGEILKASEATPRIRAISFTRNYGQTSALAAGIEAAEGEFIATLDGDLQNDPADIVMMLERLQQKELDIVVGRRAKRKDGMMLRKIPSLLANALIRRISRVYIHDYGCTLKVFRADLAKRLDLYGELHRFIPILAAIEGARIEEVDVRHHARQFGESKYGLGRTFRVFSDLLLMFFFLRYRQKPMHLFGTLGTFAFIAGGMIEVYLLILKLCGHTIGGRPLFFAGILLIITGLQLITTGFLAELLMRTHFAASHKRAYSIRKSYRGGKEEQ